MTLRTALRTSSNRAAVQLLNSVGIKNAVSYAEKLNVGTPPSVPSLALGASDVTLAQLTAAYGAFANGGVVREPVLIRRVEDSDGKVLFRRAGEVAPGGQRGDGLPDGEHAVRRDQVGHRLPRAADGLHAAGRGQDRHDQRLQRRLVRRLHAAPRHRRVGRLRPAEDDHLERLRGRARGADLGRLHEARDEGRQAGVVRQARRTSSAQRLPDVRQAARRAAASRCRSSTKEASSRRAR